MPADSVDVRRFKFTTSMRRVINRGERELNWHWGQPRLDARRIALFNLHRHTRELGQGSGAIDLESYRSFLIDTCCNTMELSVFRNDQSISVSIVDVGAKCTSAVYTFFDPSQSRYSLGTFAILKQIQWAQRTDRHYVYLGMYVAANRHLNYKARFTPQERLIDNCWVDFPVPESDDVKMPA